MLNPLNNPTSAVLEQVVQFAQARHGVLAGNIANLNTPGYKTRDLSPENFQKSLKAALDTTRQSSSPSGAVVLGPLAQGGSGLLTSSQRVNLGELDPEALAEVQETMNTLVYHDGRDVSLESQVTEITKNQGMHNLALTLMTAQYRLMRAAISETVT